MRLQNVRFSHLPGINLFPQEFPWMSWAPSQWRSLLQHIHVHFLACFKISLLWHEMEASSVRTEIRLGPGSYSVWLSLVFSWKCSSSRLQHHTEKSDLYDETWVLLNCLLYGEAMAYLDLWYFTTSIHFIYFSFWKCEHGFVVQKYTKYLNSSKIL